MSFESGLHVDYLPLAADTPAWGEDVLGVATFRGSGGSTPNGTTPTGATPTGAIPMTDVRMPVLGSSDPVCEVWRTGERLESGRRSQVRYRRGGHLLFGCLSLPESAGLHAATREAYEEIFGTLDELAYPHLLRVWNYLPQINLDVEGSERYWQFNNGRRHALLASRRDLTGNVPAACALGSIDGSPLVIYFLASRVAPVLVENPRQVSAYEYPPEYGPKPAFSRACVLRGSSAATIFISGTASIVGHRTLHADDVTAQTRETLVNIEALLEEANRVSAGSAFNLESLAYKVYVRRGADLPLIRNQLNNVLGAGARILYLQADVCRRDLLVEIEATGEERACD
jgi:chorismate lyase / 3-hydroxybenzoate synthase